MPGGVRHEDYPEDGGAPHLVCRSKTGQDQAIPRKDERVEQDEELLQVLQVLVKNKDGINFVLWPSNLLQYWCITATSNLLEVLRDSEYYRLKK